MSVLPLVGPTRGLSRATRRHHRTGQKLRRLQADVGRPIKTLCESSVPVAVRLRYNQEFQRLCAAIEDSVRYAGWNFESFPSFEFAALTAHFKYRGTRQDKEELTRAHVKMRNLGSASRHSLANHAQRRLVDEVPTITSRAPCVVFGRRDRHFPIWLHRAYLTVYCTSESSSGF